MASEVVGGENDSVYSLGTAVTGQHKQRRASMQSLAKMERANKNKIADKNALFSSIQETSWTVADHHRLYAIDRLQTRIMEYHNNVHKRGSYNKLESSGVRPDDVIAFLMTSSASLSDKSFPGFQSIEKGQLTSTTKKIKVALNSTTGGASSVQWIHLMDLSALPIIAEELKLDVLCCEHFSDLRFHSMMLPVLGGCCLSVCYFQLDHFTLSVGMFKMYFYLTEGLIVTFVAELMPELESANNSGIGRESDARAVQNFLSQDQQEDLPVPIDAVFNAVADRWEDISQRSAELGPVFVFYQLATEALAAQDTLLEFLSRTIFHFKKKTSFRLSYRKKLELVKRLHIVNTAINLVESCTGRAAEVVVKMVETIKDRNIAHFAAASKSNSSSGSGSSSSSAFQCLSIDALVPASLLGVRQLPVLVDLQNSYSFAHSCLMNEAKEVRIVSEAIDSISQMRADHTALVLSLIATIFLPATFFTGVFGMNFQEHGGYTIQIVNSKYGPLLFYILCVVLAMSLCTYYVSMGWMEAFGFVRYILNVLVGKKGMMWLLGEDFEEDINDDPEVSKPRLVSINIAALGASTDAGLSSQATSVDDDGRQGINLQSKAAAGAASSDGGKAYNVRSPLAPAHSGDTAGTGISISNGLRGASGSQSGSKHALGLVQGQVQHFVPERVAEALAEEARRQEEAAQRRSLAQLQGLHSSASSSGHPIMRGSSLGTRPSPSLQQRSRLRSQRKYSGSAASSSSDYSTSAGVGARGGVAASGKPAAGSAQSGI